MTDYSNRVAIGAGHPDRTNIEPDQEVVEFDGVTKNIDDIDIDDIPEGETIEELSKELREADGSEGTRAIDNLFGKSNGETTPEEEDVPWAPKVALAKFDPDVVDPDLVALDRLRERVENNELNKEVGDLIEDDAKHIEETIAKATSDERRRLEKSVDEVKKVEAFREAVSHATDMGEDRKEAAEMASKYVQKAVDDPKLQVKARKAVFEAFDKARQYVTNENEAPDDVIVREGPHGALYYNPEDRGKNGTLGPDENSLLDMESDELERMMEVDPDDPDNWDQTSIPGDSE